MTSLRRLPALRTRQGYTLIELLVVLAVLGVLAMMVFPMAEVTVQRDREHELKKALWAIRDAIDAYKHMADANTIAHSDNTTGYPPTLQILVAGVPNTGVGTGLKPNGQTQYFLRRMPRDPFAPSDIPAEKTWGLRSFQSSAEKPQAGADVFDVYSLSDKIGLNGIALKDW